MLNAMTYERWFIGLAVALVASMAIMVGVVSAHEVSEDGDVWANYDCSTTEDGNVLCVARATPLEHTHESSPEPEPASVAVATGERVVVVSDYSEECVDASSSGGVFANSAVGLKDSDNPEESSSEKEFSTSASICAYSYSEAGYYGFTATSD